MNPKQQIKKEPQCSKLMFLGSSKHGPDWNRFACYALNSFKHRKKNYNFKTTSYERNSMWEDLKPLNKAQI